MNQRDNGSTKARLTVRIDNETLHEIERLAQLRRGDHYDAGERVGNNTEELFRILTEFLRALDPVAA